MLNMSSLHEKCYFYIYYKNSGHNLFTIVRFVNFM